MIRFRELEVWKEAKQIALAVYELTERFPDREKFGLISQIQRAAISVASNIAEGSGRQHKKEFIHFLHLARGSLFELLTQIEISTELGLINEDDFDDLNERCVTLTKRLNSLINSLREDNKNH